MTALFVQPTVEQNPDPRCSPKSLTHLRVDEKVSAIFVIDDGRKNIRVPSVPHPRDDT